MSAPATGDCSRAATSLNGTFNQADNASHRYGINGTNLTGTNGYWIHGSNGTANFTGNSSGNGIIQHMWVK